MEEILGEVFGLRDVDSVEFLSGADVENASVGVGGESGGEFGRFDEELRVLGAGFGNLSQGGVRIEAFIAGADFGNGLVGAKAAARAAADVKEPKEGALRSGQGLQEFLHRHRR